MHGMLACQSIELGTVAQVRLHEKRDYIMNDHDHHVVSLLIDMIANSKQSNNI